METAPKRLIIGVIAIVLALITWWIQPMTYENIDAGNVGIKPLRF